jgi:oxepin-CoA hydrolase/3-oxo-5,6-dehydrosuberyl-CoA semialdehyde dehydrogenase
MGALASHDQAKEVREKVTELMKSQKIVYGDMDEFDVTGADKKIGAFFPPILFRNDLPFEKYATVKQF